MRPGIFLDRDGVINQNRAGHVKSWSEFEFLPGALEALHWLAHIDAPIAVVTNQSIIGRGLATQAEVEEINRRMTAEIRAAGGRIDGIWYCPHSPEAGCTCRKPSPGLLFAAAAELDLSLNSSYLIGDALSDVQAAQAAGVCPILVRTGRGITQLQSSACAGMRGFVIVDDLQAAADWVYHALHSKVPSTCLGAQ
jgi:D-glycero-D-manno-heptose 1,7-bisphosphate phosphatase